MINKKENLKNLIDSYLTKIKKASKKYGAIEIIIENNEYENIIIKELTKKGFEVSLLLKGGIYLIRWSSNKPTLHLKPIYYLHLMM